jgi:Tfp pilus assembly protein PilF
MPFFILPAAHAGVRLAREGRRFPMARALVVALPLLVVSHTKEYGVAEPFDLPMLYFGRAYAYSETGDLARAEEMYREALAVAPDDPRALVNLGMVLTKEGKLDEAEKALREALARDPGYGSFVWNNLALARLARGENEEALRFFQEALAVDPNDPDVYANAGNVLLSLGRLDEALARYDEALRRGTARALPVRLGRALALSGLGRGVEALAEAEAVSRLAPGIPEPWAVLAQVAAAAGDAEKAAEARSRFRALTGREPGAGDVPFGGAAR